MLENWNGGIMGEQSESKCNRREAEASYTQYSSIPFFPVR
jgi:hypothetical protein